MARSLGEIQAALTSLYDLEPVAPVEDFVCDEETARESVGDEVERREVLLVQDDADGIAIGLYVDEQFIETIRDNPDGWLDDPSFEARCVATEGVSHFVYLMFRATNETPVSQLELELQAEVDKYATGLLAGNGVGLIQERSRFLRERLFEHVQFIDDENTEAGERYRLANKLAARYAQKLEAKYLRQGDLKELARELRRFYRLGARQKIEAARE